MRLFIAIDLPHEIRHAIDGATSELKKTLRGAWVRSESFHLTLAFIGDQPQEVVEPLTDALQRSLHSHPPAVCNIAGVGVFPSATRARVGWLGVAPDQPLQSIAENVRSAVRNARVAHDDKAFKPHLTVVRFRESPSSDDVGRFMHALQGFDTEPFAVDHVTLYSSVLSPRGATHTALARVPLQGEPSRLLDE